MREIAREGKGKEKIRNNQGKTGWECERESERTRWQRKKRGEREGEKEKENEKESGAELE